jgi:hypothetical protein
MLSATNHELFQAPSLCPKFLIRHNVRPVAREIIGRPFPLVFWIRLMLPKSVHVSGNPSVLNVSEKEGAELAVLIASNH